MTTDRTLWLGRGRDPHTKQIQSIRVWTTGAPPTPDDRAEVIVDPFAQTEARDDARDIAKSLPSHEHVTVGSLQLTAPVMPRKIICVGKNYRAHAAEMGGEVPKQPLLFYKPSTALIGSGASVVLPGGYERIDMESELVLAIGKRGRYISQESAYDHVAGYSLGNDISCRDLQKAEPQWLRAKGFDTFAPVGPWLRITHEPLPGDARIRGYLDDEMRQDAALQDMVFSIPDILVFASSCMTLEPGDLIYSGTPEGVSPLKPGQTTRVELVGFDLGALTNPMVASTA